MTDYSKVTISTNDKISLIGNIATMLSSGIPILGIADSLLEDSKGGLREFLTALREDLTQGRHMYVSLDKFPRIFDKVTVSVVKASEEAGTLEQTLKDLKETTLKQHEFSDKVTSAFIYPLFIGVTFIGVLLLNLFFVVPKIGLVFENLHVPLPLPTRILIAMSNFLTKNTLLVVVGTVILVFLGYLLFTRKRNFFMGIIFSLPIISGLVKLIDLTRFTRSLYLLLDSGIPITEALDLTKDVVTSRKTAKVIEQTLVVVTSGRKLSEGLKTGKGYIPPMMIKLAEAGEETGTLDKSMADISEFFDYQVTQNLKTLTALIEPVMLVLVGIVVGGLMLAIIAPIYGLISQVGALR